MASQAIPGFSATVAVSTDGTQYNKIADLQDVTLDLTANEIDVSSHDNNGWASTILGLKKWSATAAALYIAEDVGQDAVYDALVNGTTIKLQFRPKVGTGLPEFTGDARITNWSLAGPNDGAAAINISISGDGPLTKADQV